MSTTAHFATLSPFPFCVPARDGIGGYVGGKTLEEAMTLFWNLETFTITTAGSISEYDSRTGTTYSASIGGTFTLSPFSITGAFAVGTGYANGCAAMQQNSSGGIDPGQTSRAPRERVCAPSVWAYPLPVFDVGVIGWPSMGVELGICIDPSDSTKFAVTYGLNADFPVPAIGSPYDFILVSSMPFTGYEDIYDLLANGTITICGVVIPWYIYHDAHPPEVTVTATGLGVTATSSNFTY